MNKLVVSLAAMAASLAPTLILTAPAMAQEETRVFTRSGSWVLDAGEDSCRLARAFTNGEDQVSLALERNSADNLVRMTVVGNVVRPFRTAELIGFRFLPDGNQRSGPFIRSETPDGQSYFNFGLVSLRGQLDQGETPPPAPPVAAGVLQPLRLIPYDRAAERQVASGITAIEFNEGLTVPIRLETGSLGNAIEVLQACTDDLLLSWGLDWERHQTMTRRAAPIGETWEWVPRGIIGGQDFSLLTGARNLFRVMVNAEGRPTSCQPHWVSLDEEKNRQICAAILENGNFAPALDAAGQPMDSYYMAPALTMFAIRLQVIRR